MEREGNDSQIYLTSRPLNYPTVSQDVALLGADLIHPNMRLYGLLAEYIWKFVSRLYAF